MSTAASESGPAAPETSGRSYKGKEIYEFLEDLSDYEQFECLHTKDVQEEWTQESIRILGAPSGGKLTTSIVDSQCILVGNDKCGLSMKLNIPVKAGSTLVVKLSTWVTPCNAEICETRCFGVGMIPYGKDKGEESFSRGAFTSSITHGVQYYGYFALEEMMFGGGGGGMGGMGGFSAMLAGGGDLMKYTYDVLDDGRKTSSKTSNQAKMSLAPIVVKISRDAQGNSKFDFTHGSHHAVTTRKDDGEDVQLYLNCLGWADNNTYIRVDGIAIDPALDAAVEVAAKADTKEGNRESDEEEAEEEEVGDEQKDSKGDKKKEAVDCGDEDAGVTKGEEECSNHTDKLAASSCVSEKKEGSHAVSKTDYNEMFQNDPTLCTAVDAVIHAMKKRNTGD
jgi:hypothetical protein